MVLVDKDVDAQAADDEPDLHDRIDELEVRMALLEAANEELRVENLNMKKGFELLRQVGSLVSLLPELLIPATVAPRSDIAQGKG
jgi:serine phosphatase RsbU (regulator of sigma subunit)